MDRKLIKVIELDTDIVDYIQMLKFELDGYTSLIKSIMSDSYFKYNKEIYELYQNKYQTAFNSYNLAMLELQKEYIKDIEKVFVEINFITNTLNIYEGCEHLCKS